MQCSAPVRGHRSPRAWSRCPACRGGGGWSAPRTNNSRMAGSVSTGVSSLPRRAGTVPPATGPSPQRGPRTDGRAAQVERALINAGLDAPASRDFTAALIDVAAALQAEASNRSKPSHWLCEILADAADATDPAAITSAMGDVFADALEEKGMPAWAASIAGWGIAKAAEGALSSAMPGAQLSLGLRVLGMLACPSPQDCPAGDRFTVPLLKAALATTPA